jgi:DNA-binding transcriptional LysR family regulator
MAAGPALRDLNKLNAFVRVAERRSFTKAAQDLHTSPSVVSRHIAELESSFGFSLMTRSTRGVSLTEAGEGLFRTCLQMLSGVDDYLVETRNAATGPYGSLRVLAPAGFASQVVARLASEFTRSNPKVRVEIGVGYDGSGIAGDGYDIIIANRRPNDPGLKNIEIGRIHHVVCAAPSYLRERGEPTRPAHLKEHNCLLHTSYASKGWLFREGEKEISIPVKGSLTSNNSVVLLRLALKGVGIVRLPSYNVQRELDRGTLLPILERYSRSRDILRAYFSKTKHLPQKVSAFLGLLQQAGRDDQFSPPACERVEAVSSNQSVK